MGVREQILSLPNPYDDISRDGSNKHCGYDYAKSDIADIAEAREKELLAEKAALIAELRSQIKPNATYLVVDLLVLNSILAKYESKT
jgi:hypothetical protein